MRAVKAILVLAVLAVAGLAGFAYFGDMAPDLRERSETLELPANGN